MKRRLLLIVAFLLPASFLLAQTVDRDEFSDILSTTINFVNFSGTYEHVDTLSQIVGIGTGLSQGLARYKETRASYDGRYTVIHAIGTPEEKGKAADILMFLPAAQVDHIDNVRRIVSSYLSAMYGYGKPDADILAFFITVYNAVHCGNLAFFQGRYKASVLKYLSADKVGLALRYDEWPGKTQLIIPLSLTASDKSKNSLSSVSAAALVTPEVIETVRDKPQSGTEERQKLANLMDKTVDQEQNAIDQRKAELDAELAKNREKQKQLEQQQADASKTANAAKSENSTSSTTIPGANPANSTTATTISASTNTAQTEDQKLKQQEEQIKSEQKQLDQRQEDVKTLADATKTLRDSTAADLKNQGKESATVSKPMVILKARLEKDLVLSQAQKILPSTAEILAQSASNGLLGRQIFAFGENWLALDGNDTSAVLVLLADKDLSLVKKGASTISPWSQVVLVNGGKECLAVLQQDGEWYLGRFDAQLNPVARSAIPVDPVGVILVQGDAVFVQRKDGRISQLNLMDLHVGK